MYHMTKHYDRGDSKRGRQESTSRTEFEKVNNKQQAFKQKTNKPTPHI